jgi:protein-S-isoprenylcysteine O-methyltransferase Ste14
MQPAEPTSTWPFGRAANSLTPRGAVETVAILILLNGIGSAVTMVIALSVADLRLDIGIVGLWIAPGLLRLDERWRNRAVLWLWVQMTVVAFVGMVLLAVGPDHWVVRVAASWFWHSALSTTTAVMLSVTLLLATVWWQIRQLNRGEVIALFSAPRVWTDAR